MGLRQSSRVQRLGLNHGRYLGERIDIVAVMDSLLTAARRFGWTIDLVQLSNGRSLHFLHRRAASDATGRNPTCRNIYVSAGIHGDEPAAALAAATLVRENQWPRDANLWLCPCLNPSGFPLNTRENAEGIDLNRDYLQPSSAEVSAHVEWLGTQPNFDLALCLHEDWESAGFYCYELNPDNLPSLCETIVDTVRPVCPIEHAAIIDGREATAPGIIRPRIDPRGRPQWPEAFYLLMAKTRLSYTLESPSDYPLSIRVAALVEATRTAVGLSRAR